VSLSVVRCALRLLEASVAVFRCDLHLTRTAPCVRIFGPSCSCDTKSPKFGAPDRGLWCVSSRSASTWLTPTQGSSVFAAAMLFEEILSPSSIANMSRPRRKRKKISSPPTFRPGVQSLRSPSPPPLLPALVLGVSWPLRRLSPWRRSCCAINPLQTGVRGGVLESPSSSPSPMKTWPWEEPRA
jgi:hypothetical protein